MFKVELGVNKDPQKFCIGLLDSLIHCILKILFGSCGPFSEL